MQRKLRIDNKNSRGGAGNIMPMPSQCGLVKTASCFPLVADGAGGLALSHLTVRRPYCFFAACTCRAAGARSGPSFE